ncbi:MAG: divalent-cation tolerance protein CutA [Zoogloeaceae bacterium]|jgi:periplasmic divalent cation tolerance protein|nr:divalent-cation tolerance protein CutA [Zoogloeaceae bacterium]
METLLVITTLPDAASARALAARLIEQRLAACVNILPPWHSIYRWKGKVEEGDETPLFIKTGADRYAALEAAIRAGHPYELPEIVAVGIGKGLPAYLDWVARETAAE